MAQLYGPPSDGSVIPHELEDAIAADLADDSRPIGSAARAAFGIPLRPEQFGAVGDGTTDDTAAFQAACDASAGRALSLTAGANYRITATVNVDPAKIRGVLGNLAWLLVEDGVAFNVVGNHTGTAGPATSTPELRRSEFQFTVDQTRIQGPGGGALGVGLRATKTMGLTVTNSYFADLSVGIDFQGVNRNVIIADSSVYRCTTGVRFLDGDIHQCIITDSHISYCKKAIYSAGTAQHNTLVTGCDIECSGSTPDNSQPTNLVHIVSAGSAELHEKWTFTGNQFDDHYNLSGAMILVDNTAEDSPDFQYMFTGNTFSNSPSMQGVIRLNHVENASIVGNVFQNFLSYAVMSVGSLEGLVLSDNVFDGTGDSDYQGVLRVIAEGTRPCDVKVTGNLVRDLGERFVRITGAAPFRTVSITGNSVVMAARATVNGALTEISVVPRILTLTDNDFVTASNVTTVLSVSAAATAGSVRGNTAVGPAAGSAFTLPAATASFRVSDNVGWIAPPA